MRAYGRIAAAALFLGVVSPALAEEGLLFRMRDAIANVDTTLNEDQGYKSCSGVTRRIGSASIFFEKETSASRHITLAYRDDFGWASLSVFGIHYSHARGVCKEAYIGFDQADGGVQAAFLRECAGQDPSEPVDFYERHADGTVIGEAFKDEWERRGEDFVAIIESVCNACTQR